MQPSPSENHAREHEEKSKNIVERVAELAHLTPKKAAKALNTVLCIFEQRLSGGEARKLEAELARLVERARSECPREDEEQAETFDLSEFFQRAAVRLPGSGLATGHIVAAVLAALRERLPTRLAGEVGNQLPADLRTLWDEPLPQEAPVAHLTNLLHNKSRKIPLNELAQGKPNRSRIDITKFLKQLAQRATITEPEAESIAVASLWFLLRRIPAPTGEKLSEELPREIQIQLQDALQHGGNVPDWNLDRYYELVAEQLGVRRRDVVPLVHHTFNVVRETISNEILQKAGSQLPGLMKDLWLGTPFGGDDPYSCG